MDSSNKFYVTGSPGRFGTGRVKILAKVPEQMSREDALNLAVWLKAMAGGPPEDFERLEKEIRKS